MFCWLLIGGVKGVEVIVFKVLDRVFFRVKSTAHLISEGWNLQRPIVRNVNATQNYSAESILLKFELIPKITFSNGLKISFWEASRVAFIFAVLLMILRNLFEFLISLKKNNSKIEIWDPENFWLELEIVVSKKLKKNKQTNIRLHLETAALPTELYPCICIKLFSLQAFLPARSIIP